MLNNDLSSLISPSFLTDKIKKFNEAEGDAGAAPTGADAGGLSAPADGNTPNTGSMDTDTSDMADESATEDEYQIDDTSEEGGEEGGDDMSMDDTSMEEGGDSAEGDAGGGMAADDGFSEEDPELIKKFYLLDNYNELFETVQSLVENVQEYFDRSAEYMYDDINFILTHLIALKKDIIFTVSVKFKDSDYQKLITILAYFQEELKQITGLLENVIEQDKDD